MRTVQKITLAMGLSIACLAGPSVAGQNAIPPLDHVFLIMMENHSYYEIVGSPDAPFINRLAHSANLATNYFAVGHPSLTNYLELIGGSNFGITNDSYPNWHKANVNASLNSPIVGTGMDAPTPARIAPFNLAIPAAPYIALSIADQLVAAGKSWKTYQESLPASGVVDRVDFSDGMYSNLSASALVPSGYLQRLYDVKHNPFVYFARVQDSTDPDNGLHNVRAFVGINGLYADLRAGEMPSFSFIVPNTCHDMHGADNGSRFCQNAVNLVQMGDASVKQLVTAIKASKSWQQGNNVIIVLWDENNYSASLNQVAAIVDTSYGVHGTMSNQPYNHFSLLKTLEAGFGLPCLNHACDGKIKTMSDMF